MVDILQPDNYTLTAGTSGCHNTKIVTAADWLQSLFYRHFSDRLIPQKLIEQLTFVK